jgi:putative copper export protein
MQAEPLITWSEPVQEYIGFVSQFVAVGAVGFRYAALRHVDATWERDADGAHYEARDATYATAARRAAAIGVIGAVVQALLFAWSLPASAARAHTTVAGALATLGTGSQAALLLAAVVGLALAAVGVRGGWPLALVGEILAPLTGIFTGQWSRLVNPVHRLVAGLWIGTLFVLVAAGLSVVLRDERVRARRGAMVADMVNGFSPLALSCGAIVVASGLVTAWTHLNPLSSLWTTPYGYALTTKLCLVACVFALGAWNWRRQRPSLGSDAAALAIRRSSRAELTFAALVLAVTAVLVSLPSPRPPRPPGAPAAAGRPAAPAEGSSAPAP